MTNEPHVEPEGPEWPDQAPGASFANNVFALESLSVDLRFDVRSQRVVIKREGAEQYVPLSERDESLLRWRIRYELGFDPGKEMLRDAIKHRAYMNSYDPVLAYLIKLEWDKQTRLSTWLSVYLGAEDTPLNRVVGTIILVAAVRRARVPGCRFDLVPFLIGPQGAGKSRALRTLATQSAWFADHEFLHLGPREQVEALLGVWIYELAERGGMHRTSAERYKATISRRFDRCRAAYARTVEDVPRRLVFIGTTNDPQFLRDTTGNRRFIPIKVGNIDLKALREDVRQLWAEASALEQAGCALSLPPEYWEAAAEVQAKALEVDPWIELLRDLSGVMYGDEERVSYGAVFAFLGIHRAGQNSAQLNRVSDCLRHHGWTRSVDPMSFKGTTARGFIRIRADERQRKRKKE